jgi:hypothetical protein
LFVHGPCPYGCAYGAGPNLNKKMLWLVWRRRRLILRVRVCVRVLVVSLC